MISIEAFLARFEGVRPVGENRWFARCAAHDDKSASLSIRLNEDGPRILLHDFGGGCDVGEICAAVGLSIRDLMPVNAVYLHPEERGTNYTGARASEVLPALANHTETLLFICVDLLNRDAQRYRGFLKKEERQQLIAAAKAFGDARAIINPAKVPKRK